MTKTKISLDTEFTGLNADCTLISIALVSECGKTFYAEFDDYNRAQVSRMGCADEVFNSLIFNDMKDCFSCENENTAMKDKTSFVSLRLGEWLKQFDEVEIIGDCMSWDWVLFCDLFGGAFGIPKNVFYIPFDLANLFKIKNIDPDINRLEFLGGVDVLKFEYKEHNALTDAKIVLACFNKLEL